MRYASLVFGSLLVSVCSFAAQGAPATASKVKAPPQAPAQTQAQPDQLTVQLKSALGESQKKLGELEPWQKKLFDEEVIPQYQRFIRDYRPTPSGVFVELDLESLKNYLRFFAPKSIKGSNTNITVFLKAKPSCGKCVESEAAIRALVKSRLEHRGFTVSFITAEELGDPDLAGKPLENRVADLSRLKKAAGVLVIQWQLAEAEDIDSAHADENHYWIQSFLSIRDLDKAEGRLELLENDSFENSASRLLTDAWTAIGAKLLQMTSGEPQKEILIEVSGFRDFQQYTRLKSQLTSQLKGVSTLEERKISKGRVVLAIVTSQTREEVQKQLALLQPTGTSTELVKWEVSQ